MSIDTKTIRDLYAKRGAHPWGSSFEHAAYQHMPELLDAYDRLSELEAELARVRELAEKWRAAPQNPYEPLLAMAADELEAAISQPAGQHDPLAVSDHCPECSEPEPECVCGEQPAERESLPLKAYMLHDGDPEENAALIFANNAREARKLGYLHNDIGSDGWDTLRVKRKPDADRLIPADVNEPYLVTDTRVLREAGWSCEGDLLCASCGLATMDGEFPLCDDCEQCAECGHADDCPTPAAQESDQ